MSTLLKRRGFIATLIRTFNKTTYSNHKHVVTFTHQLPQVNFLAATHPNLILSRTKSKASKKKEQAAESDEEESNEDNTVDFDSFIVDKNTKILNVKVNSLRCDVILKSGLSMARSKVEEMFYESKIRVNGKKLLKKSDLAQEGDEIDIIKGVDIKNPKFITVARVELLEVKPKKEALEVKLRRCKNLTIENYEEPWQPGD